MVILGDSACAPNDHIADRIRVALKTLHDLEPLLLDKRPARTTLGTVGRTSGAGRHLPGGTTALDLAHETVEILTYWARWLTHHHDLHPGGSRGDVPGMTVTIATHADHLAAHTKGGDCADELNDLARRVRSHVDRSPTRQFVGPCPALVDGTPCRLDLHSPGGEGLVTCPDGHTVEAAAARSRNLAEADDHLLTLRQVAELAPVLFGKPVSLNTLRVWVQRRRLSTMLLTGSTGQEQHHVRVSSVEAFVRRD